MILTPLKAIRAKCLDCCCDQFKEIRLCTAEKCSLHPYRMGKRPKRYTDTPSDTSGDNPADSPTIIEED